MKEEKIYKYRYDRRTVIYSVIYLLVFTSVAIPIAILSDGGYFLAWFISIIAALLALMIISIPRKIILNEDSLTINCVLEIAEIPLEQIVSVSIVEPKDRRWVLPIFGSFGFFGYYGYYIDWSNFEKVMVYATEWNNIVEIVNIYDDRYYLSCRDLDQFVSHVNSYFEFGEGDEIVGLGE